MLFLAILDCDGCPTRQISTSKPVMGIISRQTHSQLPLISSFFYRMEFKTFSCFDNFVPSNNCGAPDHTPTHHALHHLERLLQGISQRLKAMPDDELISAMTRPKQDKINTETETDVSQNNQNCIKI